jgi:hypothetical protein
VAAATTNKEAAVAAVASGGDVELCGAVQLGVLSPLPPPVVIASQASRQILTRRVFCIYYVIIAHWLHYFYAGMCTLI